jgi:hypothetical protein
MIRPLLLVPALSAGLALAAQKTEPVLLHFTPLFQGKALVLHADDATPDASDVETFKCYLSAFKLISKGKVMWAEKDSYHLLDASDSATLDVALAVPQNLIWDHVEFQLGIDSTTSVSGVFGGDLDPTKAMYWTWNSGYIHFKLEGHDPRSAGRGGEFSFHLGGYLSPFATVRTITLERCGAIKQHITIDLDHFLDEINMLAQYDVMSPGETAYKLSLSVTNIFHCGDVE